MEKTLEDLKTAVKNIQAENIKTEHLGVVESLLNSAVERLGLHLQSLKPKAQSPKS